jgi:inorganic pyrophosphatase
MVIDTSCYHFNINMSLLTEHGFAYKLNYGFVPRSMSSDREELDAYVIGPDLPLKIFFWNPMQ